ncbi:MAG: hypothetical protein A2571_02955 [Candidatus Vogelbacteria bacterium RIFOXYD1_FULL_44_32]|uniref:Pilus assembly protein PilO n=1 Tax=Candidatus Vogelbacteria bacterium RIFOXYD1_FULL_44_32 TaxID=1802438 RepID=A0A1G2QC96_9BACT|nr:MAG: hypothetical protein A2571_02955 [Candidatus Vogelbacteria bacterium RIFOXYD1_FULL_44_32]
MFVQIILPIVLILVGGGVYFGLTDPLIRGDGFMGNGQANIVELRNEKSALSKALVDAKALADRASDLKAKVEAISADKIQRLDDFLPDRVDDLQLIVDINNIASRSNMKISEVELKRENNKRSSEAEVEPMVATVPVSFTVSGGYADYKNFLKDIATSLRILEVKDLTFSTGEAKGEKGGNSYQLTVETYWLK